jgi:hypothetical protein
MAERTATCLKCGGEFTYNLVTRPRSYCTACRKQNTLQAYKDRPKGERDRGPKPKLIRYAGYDGR